MIAAIVKITSCCHGHGEVDVLDGDGEQARRARRRARSRAQRRSDAVITLSWRIIWRTWRRVIPIARSIPSSRVRSNTVSTRVFTIPNRLTTTESASST